MNESGIVVERYLAVAKRQWWVVLQAMVVVGAVAGFMATRADDPPFRASTTLLVAAEASTQARTGAADLRLAQRNAQVYDPAVLDAAAAAVPGETRQSVASAVRSNIDRNAGSIVITATATDPVRAVALANAVGNAFVADQKTKTTAALQERLSQTENDLAQIRTQLEALPPAPAGPAIDPNKVERDTLNGQAGALFGESLKLKNDIATADPKVEVIFAAEGASRGAKPSPLTRAASGVVVGGVLGAALAAVRETLDKRIRSRERLEREVPWAVVADLPEERNDLRRRLPTVEDPNGPLAESIRRLRTALRFLGGENGLRTVVVTSPQPGDGKTVVAVNLAVSYAQMGVSTVIVSGDLRRPALDGLFRTQLAPGFSDSLVTPGGAPPLFEDQFGLGGSGVDNVESLLKRTGIDNLRLLPSGTLPPNPAELLSSERTAKILAELSRVAEMVIIDSPPTVVVDPMLLGQVADGVLMVTSLDHTTVGPLRHAVHALEAAPLRVLGVVLNRDRGHQDTYGDYYYATHGQRPEGVERPAFVHELPVRRRRRRFRRSSLA